MAVVDATGKLVATDTIYPHTGQAAKAAMTVAALCGLKTENVERLVAIGNGTASRETERFYLDVQKQFPKVTAQKVIVAKLARRFTQLPSWQRRSSRIRRFAAWRGVYRPPFAGSAGGAGENRSEIYRRRSVSA